MLNDALFIVLKVLSSGETKQVEYTFNHNWVISSVVYRNHAVQSGYQQPGNGINNKQDLGKSRHLVF